MKIYRIHFHLVATLGLAYLVGCAPNPLKTREPADFEPAALGLQKLHQSEKIQSALIHFSVPDKRNVLDPASNNCTATVISDSGLLLTASHCFDQCRFEKDGRPALLDQYGRRTSGKMVQSCFAVINNQILKLLIVEANSCAIGKKPGAPGGPSLEKAPENCQDHDFKDLAVVLPDSREALGDFSCLPVAERKEILGESVFALGYPRGTMRAEMEDPEAKDSDGLNMMVSSGQIVKKMSCDQVIKTSSWLDHQLYGSEKRIKKNIDPELQEYISNFIQTSVDSVGGMSGGPLINSQQEIMGVVSWGIDQFQNIEHRCPGVTFVQSALDWKKNLTYSPRALECLKRRLNP